MNHITKKEKEEERITWGDDIFGGGISVGENRLVEKVCIGIEFLFLEQILWQLRHNLRLKITFFLNLLLFHFHRIKESTPIAASSLVIMNAIIANNFFFFSELWKWKRGWLGNGAGHVEGLDEAAEVLGDESLSEHFANRLHLVAHHAPPLADFLLLLLLLLLHLRQYLNTDIILSFHILVIYLCLDKDNRQLNR